VLHPELGDDPASYETERAINPLTGKAAYVLRRGADGNCVYLGASGCTIHGRHPAICREFDCGRMYEKTTRAERKRYIAQGWASKRVFDEGRRVTLIRNGQRAA
jgi:Fe-S-cluster containining protein